MAKNTLKLVALVGAALVAAMLWTGSVAWGQTETSLYAPLDEARVLAFPDKDVQVVPSGKLNVVEGKRGKALQVDQTGGTIELKGANLINPAQGTLAFWMRPAIDYAADTQQHCLLTFLSTTSGDYGLYVGISAGGTMYFQGKQQGAYIDSHFNFKWWKKPNWAVGQWYHVAVTWGPSENVVFFVNGEKVFEQKGARPGFSSQIAAIDRIVIGANGAMQQRADATLDDVVVCAAPVAPEQIKTLMDQAPAAPSVKFVTYASIAPPPLPPAPAETPQPGNQIVNGGFEDQADKSWILNNWFKGPNGEKSVTETAPDTSNPHSGKVCQRFSISQHVGGDVQFQQKLPRLTPGAGYELRFWIRGTANTKPITVWVLKNTPPYNKYLIGQVSCTEQWTEAVMRTIIPTNAPVNDLGLWLAMGDVGMIWLDDVSLEAMPAVEAGDPLTGNLLANGSFEAGHDKWYADIHGPGGRYDQYPEAREEMIRKNSSDFEIIDVPNAPHGKRVLHYWSSKLVGMSLTSAKFRLRYGHPVTVTFMARFGPKPTQRNLWFMLGSGEYGNVTTHGKRESIVITDTQWHRYSYTVTPTPSADSRYFLEFAPAGWDSDFYLDAVTVTETGKAPELTADLFQDVGWTALDANHPGNVYYQNESVGFKVLASAGSGQNSLTLNGRVLDAWQRPVKDVSLTIPLRDGAGSSDIALPSDRFGGFKLELYRAGESRMPAVEIIYCVVPRLAPLKEVKDSYFGGHVELRPHNLAIAEKAGFRWLRYHGPADTKWLVVQPKAPTPQDDGFVFHGSSTAWIAGTQRAHDMGFKILGTFGKLPSWAEDKPEKTSSPGGYSSYPPKDLEAWDKYVVETAKAFAPYIDTWETWNEPDSVFLVTAPGYKTSKEDIVVTLTARTRAALDRAGLKVTLIGPAVADVTRPLSRAVIKNNITQYLDYQSFHCYGLGQLKAIDREMSQWANLRNVKGQPVEYWQSEGGITSSEVHTWLKTTGNITDERQMARDAAGTVKILATLKALGVKKNFHYQAVVQPSGSLVYRNEWRNMIDVNGIPMPALAAHAAAVYFLEGTQDVGYSEAQIGTATVALCKFTRNGKPVNVVWSSTPVSLQKVIEASALTRPQAFDVMANPLPVAADRTLDASPVYLVE